MSLTLVKEQRFTRIIIISHSWFDKECLDKKKVTQSALRMYRKNSSSEDRVLYCKLRLDCPGKVLDVQPGNIFKGMNTKKDSTQTALQGKREREWFTEKGHGVMNILKQLSINVKLQVQQLSSPDSTAYCKSLV